MECISLPMNRRIAVDSREGVVEGRLKAAAECALGSTYLDKELSEKGINECTPDGAAAGAQPLDSYNGTVWFDMTQLATAMAVAALGPIRKTDRATGADNRIGFCP